MASNIAKYKLHNVAMKLIDDKYEERLNNAYKEVCRFIRVANSEVLDQTVLNLYEISSDKVRNLFNKTEYFEIAHWDVGTGYGLQYAHYFEKMNVDDFHRLKTAIDRQYKTFKLEESLLYKNSPSETMIMMLLKSKDLLEAVIKYFTINKEMKETKEKLECILSAKKYYPGSLKNEFPEAYETYRELYPEDFNPRPSTKAKSETTNVKESNEDTLTIDQVRNLLNN